ncbi:uncharacterized protein B0H18DRAFT_933049 [Fomitopsis serialis]|uniref:uncharacterized protein n=1 Tax=Fomitopsis serialis TaxID=139415 RepID=UPI0020072817|nr:uncharacterized protein B0H18DRAFT_933049 [Neoantrodia serialis]KAH9926393.1 hypothetical protein B0H18DRAFT_933049 [Neoantrodia serialis]
MFMSMSCLVAQLVSSPVVASVPYLRTPTLTTTARHSFPQKVLSGPRACPSKSLSVHYSLLDSQSSEEWLWISTVGDGDLRLGPMHRVFGVGMTHQQHCMQYLFDALVAHHPAHGMHAEHPEHCLNHIRQYVLCDADITLEPATVLARNWTEERWTGEYRCVDWEMMRAEIRKHWIEWKAVRDGRATDIPSLALYV